MKRKDVVKMQNDSYRFVQGLLKRHKMGIPSFSDDYFIGIVRRSLDTRRSVVVRRELP